MCKQREKEYRINMVKEHLPLFLTLYGLTEWIIWWMAYKRKLANPLSYSEQRICISYHILHIIHAYNAGIFRLRSEDATLVVCATLVICPTSIGRRDSGHMSNSGRKIWLQTYILTPDALPNSGRRHDSGRISWLRSRVTALVDKRAACLITSVVKDVAWPS
jgi:hypothetical protein